MWAGGCKYFILVLLDCSTAAFDTAYEQVFWYLRIYTHLALVLSVKQEV